MKKKMLISLLTFFFLAGGFYIFFASSRGDVTTNTYQEVPPAELSAETFPWAPFDGLVTQAVNYKETYDLDSNDWIAHFYLMPQEASVLKDHLMALPQDVKSNYRCAQTIAKDWAPESICQAAEMEKQGYQGFFYNPSLCEAGCKQNIVMWMKADGEAYIVGSAE